jgi:hypothetical protein
LLDYQTKAHWETPRFRQGALQNRDADVVERHPAAIDAGEWKKD